LRVISIISGKGGVGKTTLTANLGVLLSKMGKRVVIIDCNLTTSHLGMHFGIPAERVTLNDVLRGEKNVEEAVYEHPSGVKIIPASLSHRNMLGVDVVFLRPVVKKLDADIVLLDTPPGFERNTHGVLMASDESLIVTTPDLPAVIDVVRCTETLEDLKIPIVGLVVNMRGRGKDELTKDEIEGLTGFKVVDEIPFDKSMQRTLRRRMPISLYKPNSGSSRAMVRLAHTVEGLEHRKSLVDTIKDILRV
jgi:septum site-determining protein MinD